MNKIFGASVVVGIAIIVGVIIFQLSDTMWNVSTPEEYYESIGTQSVAHVVYPDNPQILGPLQINKDRYLLGENVFVVLKDIRTTDKGEVLFITPGGTIFEKLTFDGEVKTTYKKYFRPQLLRALDLCEKDNLVGEWTVMFRGVEQSVLHFEIVDAILPNQEYQYVECGIAYEIDIIP